MVLLTNFIVSILFVKWIDYGAEKYIWVMFELIKNVIFLEK